MFKLWQANMLGSAASTAQLLVHQLRDTYVAEGKSQAFGKPRQLFRTCTWPCGSSLGGRGCQREMAAPGRAMMCWGAVAVVVT